MPRDRIKNRVVGTQWHDNVVVDKLSTIQFPRFCRQQVWLGGKFDRTSLFLLSRRILFGKPREKHERTSELQGRAKGKPRKMYDVWTNGR